MKFYRIGFILQLSIGVSVLCLPWLRWVQPNLPRPIRVNLAWPVVYLIGTAFITIVPMIASPVETGYGLLMIFSSVPVYLVFIAWKNKPKWFQKTMGKWQNQHQLFSSHSCVNPNFSASQISFCNFYHQHTIRNQFYHNCPHNFNTSFVLSFSSLTNKNQSKHHTIVPLNDFKTRKTNAHTHLTLLGGFTQTLQKMMLVVRPKTAQAKVFVQLFFSRS